MKCLRFVMMDSHEYKAASGIWYESIPTAYIRRNINTRSKNALQPIYGLITRQTNLWLCDKNMNLQSTRHQLSERRTGQADARARFFPFFCYVNTNQSN